MSNNNSMRGRGPMGGRRGMAPGEKAKDLKGTMIKLIKYMRRFIFQSLWLSFLRSQVPYLTLSDQRS